MDLSGGGALPGEPSLTWGLFLANHRLFFWVKSVFCGHSDLEVFVSGFGEESCPGLPSYRQDHHSLLSYPGQGPPTQGEGPKMTRAWGVAPTLVRGVRHAGFIPLEIYDKY